MTEPETQTDNPQGGQEGAAKTSDFEKLLKEFESKPADKSADFSSVVKGLEPVVSFAKQAMEEKIAEATKKEVDSALSFMTESEKLKKLPPKLIRGYLEATGIEDPSFVEAWKERAKNPTAWKTKLEQVRTEAEKELGGLGSDIGKDVDAAKAAIGGRTEQLSDEKPDPVDLMNMSDSAFDQYKAKLARKR